MRRIIIFLTFFLSILLISTVILPYDPAVKRVIVFIYALWVITLGDILDKPKFYVYGGFLMVVSILEAPFLIASALLNTYTVIPKIPLLQTRMPPAGSTFMQPAVLSMIVLISAFGMMLWIVYGEERGRAFKFASMTMIMTPPLIVFIETMTLPTDQLRYYIGEDLANIIDAINFPPLEFLVRGVISLLFFMVFIIIAIAISVLASVLKSYMA